jgi:hypothetical protein
MAQIEIEGQTLVVRLTGFHKLWALKDRIEAPLKHVTRVEANVDDLGGPKGMRLPGSHFPGLITAGSYRGKNGWDFWDVRRPEKVIVIHLSGERYNRLIVEVADPAAAAAMIEATIASGRPGTEEPGG